MSSSSSALTPGSLLSSAPVSRLIGAINIHIAWPEQSYKTQIKVHSDKDYSFESVSQILINNRPMLKLETRRIMYAVFSCEYDENSTEEDRLKLDSIAYNLRLKYEAARKESCLPFSYALRERRISSSSSSSSQAPVSDRKVEASRSPEEISAANTAFEKAVLSGDLVAAEDALSRGADPNHKIPGLDYEGDKVLTLLYHIVKASDPVLWKTYSNRIKWIELLVRFGADPIVARKATSDATLFAILHSPSYGFWAIHHYFIKNIDRLMFYGGLVRGLFHSDSARVSASRDQYVRLADFLELLHKLSKCSNNFEMVEALKKHVTENPLDDSTVYKGLRNNLIVSCTREGLHQFLAGLKQIFHSKYFAVSLNYSELSSYTEISHFLFNPPEISIFPDARLREDVGCQKAFMRCTEWQTTDFSDAESRLRPARVARSPGEEKSSVSASTSSTPTSSVSSTAVLVSSLPPSKSLGEGSSSSSSSKPPTEDKGTIPKPVLAVDATLFATSADNKLAHQNERGGLSSGRVRSLSNHNVL